MRPLRADTKAVVAFYERTHDADPSVSPIDGRDWTRFLASPVNAGGRDFRVAVAAGAIVGLATSSLRTTEDPWVRHFRVIVEPAWRRRGVGRALVAEVTRMDTGNVELQALCPETWLIGAAFLEGIGFRLVEYELEMECRTLAVPERGDAKWTIRRVNDNGAVAGDVARIHNEAYEGTISYVRYSGEEMIRVLEGAELFVAERDGRVVGFAHIELGADDVWLESLAVEGASRSHGVGVALAHAGLCATLSATRTIARLNLSDRDLHARRIYEGLGFQVVHSSARYRAPRGRVSARIGGR
ncbi:MAG: GNAT family N-acetyltransferase [Myxococcota bacterium]